MTLDDVRWMLKDWDSGLMGSESIHKKIAEAERAATLAVAGKFLAWANDFAPTPMRTGLAWERFQSILDAIERDG